MFRKTFSALLLAAAAVAQVDFSIATPPALTECQPSLLTWTGGQAPYIIWISQPNQPAQRIDQIGEKINGNSLTWVVNQQAGTSFTINISDAVGKNTGSAPVTVMAGSDKSCIGKTPSTTAGGGAGTTNGGGTTTGGSGGTTSSTGTAQNTNTGTGSKTDSPTTSKADASKSTVTTTQGSGAMANAAPVAAVVALAGAALLF